MKLDLLQHIEGEEKHAKRFGEELIKQANEFPEEASILADLTRLN
jgi:hypothetical protein